LALGILFLDNFITVSTTATLIIIRIVIIIVVAFLLFVFALNPRLRSVDLDFGLHPSELLITIAPI
jgi:hypothetical protein